MPPSRQVEEASSWGSTSQLATTPEQVPILTGEPPLLLFRTNGLVPTNIVTPDLAYLAR